MRAVEATVALPADQADDALRSALATRGSGARPEIDIAAVRRDELSNRAER